MQNDLSKTAFNFLEHPVIGAYFAAKEHVAYYHSLKRAATRRDFHDRLILALLTFFEQASAQHADIILDQTIFNVSTSTEETIAQDDTLDVQSDVPSVLEDAKQKNPRDFELLDIVHPLTFNTLTKCYHAAAKKHHPDYGGATENMQTINAAFHQFHDLLCEYIETGGSAGSGSDDSAKRNVGNDMDGGQSKVRSTLDYLYVISRLLISVYLDEWAIDHAYHWFNELMQRGWIRAREERRTRYQEWQAQQQKRAEQNLSHIFSSYSDLENFKYPNFISLCCDLATRLHAAGLSSEAQNVLLLTQTYQYEPYEVSRIMETLSSLQKKKKLIKVPTHLRQVENAYRLKLIDTERYVKTMQRFRQQAEENVDKEKLLSDAVTKLKIFKNLPMDRKLQDLPAPTSLNQDS